MRKQEQAKSPEGESRKPMMGFFVPCSLGELIARHPKDYVIASQLCRFLCLSDKVTGGVIKDAKKVLKDALSRGGMYLKPSQIQRILSGNSHFWRWDGDQKENLIVTLFDAEKEAKFANRSKTLAANAQSRWKKRKTLKAHANADANAHANADANAHANADAINKEKDFPSENLSNGGGSTEVAPRSFDDSISDDDSKPLSPEETAAFFKKMRRVFSDDTEQASNQSTAAGSEAKSTPET